MFDRPLFTTLPRRSRHHLYSAAPLPQEPPVAPLPIINDQPPLLLVFDPTDLGIELAYERHFVPGGPSSAPRPARARSTGCLA